MSESDPIRQLRDRAKKRARDALGLAEIAGTTDAVDESRPQFTEAAIAHVAGMTGTSIEDATRAATEVIATSQPAIRVERFRAENELRDEFLKLYAIEITRMRTCPVAVNRKGKREACGVGIRTIQEALVHHSMHLLWESDARTARQVNNDISEKLFPTEIRGVSAVLGPEERASMLADPRYRARMLGHGGDSD